MDNAEKRIVVHNPSAMLLYVGSEVVPPGETRDFPESQVPAHLRSAAAPTAPEPVADPLADLLNHPVKAIAAALAERSDLGVPVVSDEQLAALKAAEEAGKNRSTLLAAIAEETLRRANERAEAEAAAVKAKTEQEAFLALIASMDDAELGTHRELVADDAALVALVDAEIAKRAGG